MKHYKRFLFAAVLGFLMILIEGCFSSVLVDVRKDMTFHDSPLNKILIISLRKNPVQRRIWEDAFVAEFSKQGVKATSSYLIFPNALPDTNQIVETVKENGFDGILVIRLLQKEAEANYVQGYVTTESRSIYNPFRNTYSSYFQNVQYPGYIDSSYIDSRAMEVWVIRDKEHLIWAATSNTPERNTIESVQKDIADLVIPSLEQNAIVKSVK